MVGGYIVIINVKTISYIKILKFVESLIILHDVKLISSAFTSNLQF